MTEQEDIPISLTGSMLRIQDTLKQIDAEMEHLDEIFSSEGVCPTPELQQDDGSCACKYDMACNLGDPKPRREAHVYVKKAIGRIQAWM